jgi:hypothetical protein
MATPATEKQVKALQLIYKRLRSEDDVRTRFNFDTNLTQDDICALWTKYKIGRIPVDPNDKSRPSWKGLSMAEAGYLLDILNGKETRLDAALRAEFTRLDVDEHAAYFDAYCRPRMKHSKNMWTYGGRAFEMLNFRDKCELLKTLKTRSPALRAS